MERADEVLALGQVDAGLAADRGVDLGDEGRRHLDEGHAAEVGRGEEAGRVAERAAADGDERLAPLDPEARQLPRGVLDDRQAFRGLALRQQDALDRPAVARQAVGDAAPAAAHAPGSEMRIARRAPAVPQRGPDLGAAMPSPITSRPIACPRGEATVPDPAGARQHLVDVARRPWPSPPRRRCEVAAA